MAENASLFLSYGEFQNLIRLVAHRTPEEKLPLYQLALAAAGAGAVTSFILYVPTLRTYSIVGGTIQLIFT
jgi:ornithine carrier protein